MSWYARAKYSQKPVDRMAMAVQNVQFFQLTLSRTCRASSILSVCQRLPWKQCGSTGRTNEEPTAVGILSKCGYASFPGKVDHDLLLERRDVGSGEGMLVVSQTESSHLASQLQSAAEGMLKHGRTLYSTAWLETRRCFILSL